MILSSMSILPNLIVTTRLPSKYLLHVFPFQKCAQMNHQIPHFLCGHVNIVIIVHIFIDDVDTAVDPGILDPGDPIKEIIGLAVSVLLFKDAEYQLFLVCDQPLGIK